MAKDPAFMFYSSDFLTGTMFMSNEQVGIYVRLLCAQHQHGGLIDKIAFNSMVGNHDIIRSKFVESENGYFNVRLLEEMDKRKEKSCNLSANAKAGWEKRKQMQCKCNANASNLHMPIEDENENENEVVVEVKDLKPNERFEIFWKAYPRKEAKKVCKAIWTKLKPSEELLNTMLQAIESQKQTEKWVQNCGQYIPMPSTWLNQSRWEDEIKIDVAPKKGFVGQERYTNAMLTEADVKGGIYAGK